MAANHKKNDWDKNKKIPGLVGPEGPQGTSGGTGPQGPKGDKGDTGATGATGPAGADGADGADGQGVPTGGSSGQLLIKQSATDFDTLWKTVSGDATVDSAGALTLSSSSLQTLISAGVDIGSFGPTMTFATPGDSSFSFSNSQSVYIKIGTFCIYLLRTTFTPTYTAASGLLQIILPFTNSATSAGGGSVYFFTGTPTFPAGVTYLSVGLGSGSNFGTVSGSGSATNAINFSSTQFPSGSTFGIQMVAFFRTS